MHFLDTFWYFLANYLPGHHCGEEVVWLVHHPVDFGSVILLDPHSSLMFCMIYLDWMFCQWDFSCLRGVSLFSNLGLRTEDFFLLCSADLTWHAFCQICCINISVNHRGRPDIVRHWEADKYRGRAQTLDIKDINENRWILVSLCSEG